jgi:hypothetical protein
MLDRTISGVWGVTERDSRTSQRPGEMHGASLAGCAPAQVHGSGEHGTRRVKCGEGVSGG